MGKSGVGLIAPIYYLPTIDNAENKKFVDAFRAKHNRFAGVHDGFGLHRGNGDRSRNRGDQRRRRKQGELPQGAEGGQAQLAIGPFQFDEKQNIVFDLYLGRVVERNGTFGLEIVEPMMKHVNQFGVSN